MVQNINEKYAFGKKMKLGVKILLIAALAVSFIMIAWVIKKGSYSGEDAWNELMALEVDITMDDLKRKGYLDVSQVMDSENEEITAFLEDARNRNNCRLRIANIVEGTLCAKILVYNRDLNAIEMWTMRPNRQQADDPGKRFSTETYAIEENDVITVYFKNIPNTSFPIAPEDQIIIDEALYSYVKK